MFKKIAVKELKTKIIEKLPLFNNKKVLVIGDVGVDEYVLGHVRRISPEAPVPVLEVDQEDCRLGLSGNVAQNIQSLGGTPFLLSIVGMDTGAETLKRLLKENQISTDFLLYDSQRPTTRKTRVMAQHHHLVRVDYETRQMLSPQLVENLLAKAEELIPKVDVVILQDYAKGVISESVVQRVVKVAQQNQKLVLMDPHRLQSLDSYRGVDLLKPNFDEALALMGMSHEEFMMKAGSITELGQALRARVDSQWVVLTQGKEGMMIFDGQNVLQVPTFARQVFDVTGAGDTVIAALALGLASQFTMAEACVLANFAAGVVVGKIGCVPCQKSEIIEYMGAYNP